MFGVWLVNGLVPAWGIADLGMQILKLLAVVGGAALGWVGIGLVVQLLCKLLVKRKLPGPAIHVVRFFGAVLVGLAVWLWVSSGSGSGGLGGGGGWWPFGAGKGGPPNGTANTPTATAKDKPPVPDDPRPSHPEILRIEMLGGERVLGDRFYLIPADQRPRTLAELQKTLEEQKPSLKGIEIVIYLNSVAESHPAVAQLKQRAQDLDLTIKTTKPGTVSGE